MRSSWGNVWGRRSSRIWESADYVTCQLLHVASPSTHHTHRLHFAIHGSLHSYTCTACDQDMLDSNLLSSRVTVPHTTTYQESGECLLGYLSYHESYLGMALTECHLCKEPQGLELSILIIESDFGAISTLTIEQKREKGLRQCKIARQVRQEEHRIGGVGFSVEKERETNEETKYME
jgi:hypothetical protein